MRWLARLFLFSCLALSCAPARQEPEAPLMIGEWAPPFVKNMIWLNTDKPFSWSDLKGHVTLLHFWTSSSINAVRSLKFMNRWYSRYRSNGTVLIGIHSPQFSYEQDPDVIDDVLGKHVVMHPVVLDNEFVLWSGYRNRAWPAFYLVDAQGKLRHIVVGEDRYEELEAEMRALMDEAGYAVPPMGESYGPHVVFSQLGTPEIHVGYDLLSHFGSPEPVLPDRTQAYGADASLEFNHFYLVGDWEIQKERAVLRGRGGKLLLHYEASRVYAVLGSVHANRLRAEVRLDGEPLTTETYGGDIWFRDGRSFVEIDQSRLYELVDTYDEYEDHILEITFLSSDAEVFSIMFG